MLAAGIEWPIDEAALPISVLPELAGRPGDPVAARVVAVSAGWQQVTATTATPSSALAQLSGPARDHVALVGTRLARRLHLPTPGPGVRVWVRGQVFDVVGIIPGTDRRPELADGVVIATPAVTRFVDPVQTAPTLLIRTRPAAAHAVADVVARAVAPDRPSSIDVAPVLDLAALRRGVATSLDRTVALVSGLVLALAALAIANAMVVSVIARRGEIGLRRALGASSRSVAGHVLLEGILIGIGGGVLGSALGTAAVLAVNLAQGWTAVLSPALPLIGPGIGVVVGLVSALHPARQAARVQPAVAVRQQA